MVECTMGCGGSMTMDNGWVHSNAFWVSYTWRNSMIIFLNRYPMTKISNIDMSIVPTLKLYFLHNGIIVNGTRFEPNDDLSPGKARKVEDHVQLNY